ncbi:hypothetical protein BaRGS_00003634 [Batillaria attramentaria]|uniref:Uncharacterized protein n=1 Tax=Batillaria attramentaria TaxID=370345 RepID=A0ABD0LZY0_9CAEN
MDRTLTLEEKREGSPTPNLTSAGHRVYLQSRYNFSKQVLSSEPFNRDTFQYLKVVWIRLHGFQDGRVVQVKYESNAVVSPQVAWLVDGRLVSDYDDVLTGEFDTQDVTSILIPSDVTVSQLQVLLVLEAVETLVDINLQDIADGTNIVEHGTDVALALSSQEDITYQAGDSLRFFTRFFAEDLPQGSYTGLHVQFTRMTPSDPDTVQTLTSLSDRRFLSVRRPLSNEFPADVHRSPFSDFKVVGIRSRSQEVRGLIEFTAAYDNNAPCRLFGGQQITRRAFIRQEGDNGSYWGSNGHIAFLPLQQVFTAPCHGNLDVNATAFGEESPDVTLMKHGNVVRGFYGISVFTFRRLLQTEAVFRFTNIRENMGGVYTVRAEVEGQVREIEFELSTEESC